MDSYVELIFAVINVLLLTGDSENSEKVIQVNITQYKLCSFPKWNTIGTCIKTSHVKYSRSLYKDFPREIQSVLV